MNTICFASGSVTECNSTVEVNNSSKSDGYDRTTKLTGRELVNTTCFASDSVIESAPEVEVNNASEIDRPNGATRVAWGVAIKDLSLMCHVVAFDIFLALFS